jgi:hypothetical protein
VWGALHKNAGEIVAAWPGGGTVPVGCLLDKTSLRLAWESEAYRQNANPNMLGGQGLMHPNGPPTIPGARGGDLQLLHQPDKLPSFVDATAQANGALLAMLNGSASAIPRNMAAVNGASAPATGSALRSAAETQLAKLLQEQLKLSEDISPEGEKAYQDHLKEIERVSAEVDAEKRAAPP